MSTAEVRAQVERVLREILHIGPEESIDDTTRLFADLGVASVDLRLTPAGAAEVRRRLPHAAFGAETDGIAVYDIFPAITVGDVVAFFARRTEAS
jgi:hypothetical protein